MTLLFILLSLISPSSGLENSTMPTKQEPITIKKTDDFKVTGDGNSKNWNKTSWIAIKQQKNNNIPLETKFKTLYSKTGIYFLFQCEDTELNATIQEDYKHLWKEDVVEVFLWPDESTETYFEYELSPLNYELPLLITNVEGKHHRWQPWFYEDDRKVLHATSTKGGPKKSGAKIDSWSAEFFIPFSLLSIMKNTPPISGTKWKSNLYRMDYSDNTETYWSWQKVKGSFHGLDDFGTLVFE